MRRRRIYEVDSIPKDYQYTDTRPEYDPKETLKNESGAYIWPWFEKIAGFRELSICFHKTAVVSNYDPDYPNDRLPKGTYHVTSEIGRFTIDSKTKSIVG